MSKKIIPVGPYHPLQEEPEFFQLHVDGERVVDIDIIIGYNHRGIEKLCEMRTFDQVVFVVERICGICSISHPSASVNCIEDCARVTAPLRAQYIRMIIAELERIHSHMLWLGLAGHFIGYNTVFMWAWKYREIVLDIFERITGNRQSYAMFKPGGIRRDIKKEEVPKIINELGELERSLEMFRGAVLDDPVLHARLKGVGILTREDVITFSAVGPTARASGVAIDVRKDDPYFAYDKVDFDMIVTENGDVFDKVIVRVLEMFESVRIIKQGLTGMPDGPYDTPLKDMPPGEGVGRAEAPRGEVYHYLRSDGSNTPARYKVRAPSFMNVATNAVSAVGQSIADATLTLAAVDPCYCCTERMQAVDYKTRKKVYNWSDLVRLSQEKTQQLKKKF
ncbi:MAG: nickel-dependent hydrogenase large subunit [Candidatus Omnitrophica bacterium]|nr:nickel-dependent hydrogenase large subunit [Candidatus Omnitrophota bacterium]